VSVKAPSGAVAGKVMLQFPFKVDLVLEALFSVKERLTVPEPW